MKCGHSLSWALAGCAGLAMAGVARADVVSTFDTDAEGWSLANGAGSFTWGPALGNPGGGISGIDSVGGQLWYFSASAAFLGDQSAMSGGTLSWDRRNLVGGSAVTEVTDAILQGAGLRIGYAIPGNIDLPTWQTFSVPLSPAGWFLVGNFPSTPSSGTAVTPAQFADILADLTGMYLQGEYRNGNDSGALDNVIMVPAPTICPECAADYDGNGGVDGGDLAAFFADFEAGETCADVDGNGGVDGGDLAEFFSVFEAGGC